MYFVIRNGHKLFDKMLQRTASSIRHSIKLSTLCYNHTFHYDPVTLSAENEELISWTSKISSLVRQNKPNEASGLFKTMLYTAQRPNFVTLVSVIKAFGALEIESLIWVVHCLVIKLGFESDAPVLTALLGYYAIYDMGLASKLFYQMLRKDVIMCSAMVNAFVKNGQYMEAIRCFRRMQFYNVVPNHVSVLGVLSACVALGSSRLGREIHGFCIKRMLYSYTNVRNSLIDVYAKCGEFEAATRVFDGMWWKKDIISWRAMIQGCIENKRPIKALSTLSEMQCSFVELDESVVRSVIVALLQGVEVKPGLVFHCYLQKNGFLAFVSICTALIQFYAKSHELASARKLFDQLNYRDSVAWSAMISIYAKNGWHDNAINMFKQMQSTNENPNEFTFVSLLQTCSSMATQELGNSIHAHLIKAGYSLNSFLASSLIDFYCKHSRTNQAKVVFDEISTKDVVCWSSMINCYGSNGFGEEALLTFTKMLNCGIKPNDTVFLSILSSCSHCGLKDEGRKWFYCMQMRYGIVPKLAHYACMVDLLSRHGEIEEALDFVKKMPIEPDKRIWGALLAGCRKIQGSTKIAEFVTEQLTASDPQKYMLPSNFIAR